MKIATIWALLLIISSLLAACKLDTSLNVAKPLTLPADEANHNAQTEWWYFNAHISAEEPFKRRWALHQVLFLVHESKSRRTMYVAHGGLADVHEKSYIPAEKIRIDANLPNPIPYGFDIKMNDWQFQGENGNSYMLKSRIGNSTIFLNLTNSSGAILHGDAGVVELGPAGLSFYYSRPRLNVEGTIVDENGTAYSVSGLAWMDKQWGDFKPSLIGWDWASIQLDDGRNIMLTRILSPMNDEIAKYGSLSSYRTSSGLSGDHFTFRPLINNGLVSDKQWSDSVAKWKVKIPSADIDVFLVPLVKHSSFKSTILGIEYWESGVDVINMEEGVSGQGFIEMTRPI